MSKRVAYVGLMVSLSIGIGAVLHQGVTSALFTAQATNPTNTFQAGTLRIANSRDGSAVFTASMGESGPVTTGTSVTVASGTVAFGGLTMPSVVSGTMPTTTGFDGPIAGSQRVNGTGGMAPGTILVNSLTIGNVGTLSAGAVVLSVPSVSVANWPSMSCDASSILLVGGVDVCGRGRLTDVLRVTAWYAADPTSVVCVLGGNRGVLVTAASDSEAYLRCSGADGLGERLTVSDDGPTLPLAPLGAPDGVRVQVTGQAAAGPRVVLALAQGVRVKNYRNGALVDDWGPGVTRSITFAVAFDPLADNRYAGAQASVDMRWNAVSLTGAPAVTGTIN